MSTAAPKPTRLRLRLSPAAEKQVRAGHPWVFAASVREQNRPGQTGELAVIYDRQDKFLALGFFDPDSPIRLRVVHLGKPCVVDAAFWRQRLETAVARRTEVDAAHTTGYRVINGESDGWPGLVLDRYDATLVLKIYTSAWLCWLPELLPLLRARFQPTQIVFRSSRNIQAVAIAAGWRDGAAAVETGATAPAVSPVTFQETGIHFHAEVARGQKTGFFLDQRENRRLVATFAGGRSVLNAFSFSGGFSLYAARGGATTVTDVDISAHALAAAKQNFALNASDPPTAQCRHESVQADVFEWLGQRPLRKYDVLILDPPSLAKREAERGPAWRAYGRLVQAGLNWLNPKGLLVACSCSAHVSAGEFFELVRQTARTSGRQFTELHTTRHAPDHPATFTEAEYLKGIYLRG